MFRYIKFKEHIQYSILLALNTAQFIHFDSIILRFKIIEERNI